MKEKLELRLHVRMPSFLIAVHYKEKFRVDCSSIEHNLLHIYTLEQSVRLQNPGNLAILIHNLWGFIFLIVSLMQ